MAENKKSFLLYCDLIHTIEKMPTEKAGELFLHILKYVNDKNPITEDLIISLTFEPIKQSLKRDLTKWEEIRQDRRKAGLASAEKRKQKQQASTHVENSQQEPTNPTVSVSVNDSVKVKNKNKDVAPLLSSYQLCVDFWLKEFKYGWVFEGVQGKALKAIIKKIESKLKESKKEISPNSVLDVFKVICLKLPEWYKDKDLPVINSKFNEIITDIKNERDGTSKTTKPISKYHN